MDNMDGLTNKKKPYLKGLYLHCADFDYIKILCPSGHVMYTKFRPEAIGTHPRRSLHCEECNYYYNVDRITMQPFKLSQKKSFDTMREAAEAFWASPPIIRNWRADPIPTALAPSYYQPDEQEDTELPINSEEA